jgi:ribosome-associated translation inhibitor RaiA
MHLPLQIQFHGIDHSDAIEARVRQKAAKLDRLYGHIMGCRVVIDAPHRHQRKGNTYNVRIDLTVPGGEIVVNRDPADDGSHTDVYVALRDAFNAAGRALEDFARRQRGDIKSHSRAAL